jgi:hypothetical protein
VADTVGAARAADAGPDFQFRFVLG